MTMNPMEPGPEEFDRILAERRAEMQSARAIAYRVHSRAGLLARFVQRLADRVDPSGRTRRDLR